MGEHRAWLYKWNDHGASHASLRRNWGAFFDEGQTSEGFGRADGEGGSRLAKVQPGDLLIAYQTDEKAAVGLCRVLEVNHDKPSLTFHPIERFSRPARLHELKHSDPVLDAMPA